MLVTFSWRHMIKYANAIIKLIVFLIIMIFILHKMLSLFWDFTRPNPIRDQQLMEKPLRVITMSIYAG